MKTKKYSVEVLFEGGGISINQDFSKLNNLEVIGILEVLKKEALDRLETTEPTEDDKKKEEFLNTPISGLDWSTRTYNCLRSTRAHSVGELIQFSTIDLLKFRNLGPFVVREVRMVLKKHGIEWG